MVSKDKRLFFTLFCVILFCFAAGFLTAAPVVVKVASIAPETTAWGKALNQMSKEWAEVTGGGVELQVYHNSVLGSDEREVLQKLRTNQIQAAVFTSIGMNSITKRVFTLSCPFLIRNNDEMDFVLNNINDSLEVSMNQAGFQLIAWSRVGWIRFFSRNPVSVPQDLKRQKLSGPTDMPELSNMFKSLGYTVIPSEFSDALMALTANKIDAVFQIPPYVAAMQVFNTAKNMLPLDIAPVLGGIVMNQQTWRRIPDKYKSRILEVSRRIAQENDLGAQKLSADAIQTMTKYGLVTSSMTPAQEQLWRNEAATALPSMLGDRNTVIDPDTYHQIQALLNTYREKQKTN